jgi:hypothetical protein
LQRRTQRFDQWRDATLVAFTLGLLVWAGATARVASGTAPPRINGSYSLTFAGDVKGTGDAVVTPKSVRISGTVTDSAGNELQFSAPLDIDASTYRFSGTGTLGTQTVTVSGRLDPDDKSIHKCRIVATFVASEGPAGRIAGGHK